MSGEFKLPSYKRPAPTYGCSRCGTTELITQASHDAQEAQFAAFRDKHKDCRWGAAEREEEKSC